MPSVIRANASITRPCMSKTILIPALEWLNEGIHYYILNVNDPTALVFNCASVFLWCFPHTTLQWILYISVTVAVILRFRTLHRF